MKVAKKKKKEGLEEFKEVEEKKKKVVFIFIASENIHSFRVNLKSHMS